MWHCLWVFWIVRYSCSTWQPPTNMSWWGSLENGAISRPKNIFSDPKSVIINQFGWHCLAAKTKKMKRRYFWKRTRNIPNSKKMLFQLRAIPSHNRKFQVCLFCVCLHDPLPMQKICHFDILFLYVCFGSIYFYVCFVAIFVFMFMSIYHRMFLFKSNQACMPVGNLFGRRWSGKTYLVCTMVYKQ